MAGVRGSGPEREGAVLDALERLALADRHEAIERALDAARELLDMEIAYFSEIGRGEQVVKGVRGDTGALPLAVGAALPLEATYCRRMLAGELSNVVSDARNDPRVSDLPATTKAGVGSYVGVPLQLSDGRVYGTLCCASSRPNERLGPRDVQFMRVLARIIADELEREHRRLPGGRAATPPPAEPAEAAAEAAETDVPDAILKLDLWFIVAAHAVSAARATLAVLAEHVDRGFLEDARLLVTELVSNSVRHAGVGRESAVGLALHLTSDCLAVAVSDPGSGFRPEVVEPHPEQVGGRGLFIVDQLADRWGVGDSPLRPPGRGRASETATVVWFELRRGRERAASGGS